MAFQSNAVDLDSDEAVIGIEPEHGDDVEENQEDEVESVQPEVRKLSCALFRSLFRDIDSNRPSTVAFVREDGPSADFRQPDLEVTLTKHGRSLKFRMPDYRTAIVRKVLKQAGFKEAKEDDWNVMWSKPMAPDDCYRVLNMYQRVNHFPGTYELGRKDRLYSNIQKMRRRFPGKDFDFLPRSFVLPSDLKEMEAEFENGECSLWIVKPRASSRGRGIKLLTKAGNLPRTPCVVQRYVASPYLVNEKKFDLRLYVACMSFDPLRIYVHEEGLVRFCTVKYRSGADTAHKRFMHLTNYSVQKKSNAFVPNQVEDRDDEGNKWSLAGLWRHLKETGVDVGAVWASIKDVIVKAFIGAESQICHRVNQFVPHRGNCFELFGVDILLDSNLKPYLMEVNTSPSLNSSSPLDRKIKAHVLADLFNMASIVPYNRAKYTREQQEKKLQRLTGETTTVAQHEERRRRHIAACASMQISFDVLSQEDLSYLIELEDEASRAGTFQRIFPCANGDHYLPYFETLRFHNLLLVQYTGRALTHPNLLHSLLQKPNRSRPSSKPPPRSQSSLSTSHGTPRRSSLPISIPLQRPVTSPAVVRRFSESSPSVLRSQSFLLLSNNSTSNRNKNIAATTRNNPTRHSISAPTFSSSLSGMTSHKQKQPFLIDALNRIGHAALSLHTTTTTSTAVASSSAASTSTSAEKNIASLNVNVNDKPHRAVGQVHTATTAAVPYSMSFHSSLPSRDTRSTMVSSSWTSSSLPSSPPSEHTPPPPQHAMSLQPSISASWANQNGATVVAPAWISSSAEVPVHQSESSKHSSDYVNVSAWTMVESKNNIDDNFNDNNTDALCHSSVLAPTNGRVFVPTGQVKNCSVKLKSQNGREEEEEEEGEEEHNNGSGENWVSCQSFVPRTFSFQKNKPAVGLRTITKNRRSQAMSLSSPSTVKSLANSLALLPVSAFQVNLK